MEGLFYEIPTIVSVAVFTGLLFLIAVAAGVILAGMAEEEKEGARLFWAEWPIAGAAEVTAPEEKVRLAA